uniref:Uncharacterized protein n=1 Tax=Oryza brachyantha TaxID=4533 RepID=J3MQ62_ORYBR
PLINSKMAPSTRPQKRAKSSSNNESSSVSTRSRMHQLALKNVNRLWDMDLRSMYRGQVTKCTSLSLMGKFDMNANDEVARATCTNIIKDGIRQQRYRLKSKYFNNVPISEVLSKGPPPRVSPEDWAKLVEKWTDPKHKNAMVSKREQNQEEGGHAKLDEEIVAEVLSERNTSSTFLVNMGFPNKKSGNTTSSMQVQELRDQLRVEKEDNARKQHQLTEQLESQQQEITELKRKHQEEMDNLKKSQDEKMDGLRKKQDEMEAMFRFFIRQQQTQSSMDQGTSK